MVGGHATVCRLSNNVFSTFQAIWKFFEKCRWTVTRQWSEVTRPSTDCRTTFFRRFKQFGFFSKKSLNGHATVVGGHATVGWLSNNVFLKFRAIRKIFKISRWTVTRPWSEVTRPSADCQTTLLNGHVTVVGGHATVGRLSNSVFSTFQTIRKFFEKSRWTVTRQWSEVTRPLADCQTTFFRRFKQFGKISKKNRWTVTRQWSEVTRLSADCQTTFYRRFFDVPSNSEKFWKKVAERSRDGGRRSRDR